MRQALAIWILCVCSASAMPYQWESQNGESPFSLDVPESWRAVESKKRNGVIVRFAGGGAHIEIRSLADKDLSSQKKIMNQKAARLASQYNSVRLIDERDSRYRENLHLSVWEIKAGGKVWRDETAIIVGSAGPVVVSCMVPLESYQSHRTHCENAFYSVTLETVIATMKPGETVSNSDLMFELSRLYFLNMPGNLPVLTPETLLKTPTTAPKPETTPQYDENFILPDEKNK